MILPADQAALLKKLEVAHARYVRCRRSGAHLGSKWAPGLLCPAVSPSSHSHVARQCQPHSDQYQSMLTPSVTNASRKLFCCDEAQRRLRGGRYASCPLRTTSTLPLLRHTLVDGACGLQEGARLPCLRLYV